MAKRLSGRGRWPLPALALSGAMAGSGLAAPAAQPAVPADLEIAAANFVACLRGFSEIPESERICGASVAWHRKKLPALTSCLAAQKITEASVHPKSGDGQQSARLMYSCQDGRLVGVRLVDRGQGFAVDAVAELVID